MISKKAITIISIAVGIFLVGMVFLWTFSGPQVAQHPTYSPEPSYPVEIPQTPWPESTPLPSPIPHTDVAWLATPQKLPLLGLFIDDSSNDSSDYYKLGSDHGNDIIFRQGYGLDATNFFFLERGSAYVLLLQNSGDWRGTVLESVGVEPEIFYPALLAPNELIFSGHKLQGGWNYRAFTEYTNLTRVGQVSAGTLYSQITPNQVGLSLQNYVLRLPSGIAAEYVGRDWSFVTDDQVPQITWSGGIPNTDRYSIEGIAGGCGNPGKVALLLNPDLSQFMIGGVTSGNEPVYVYKNPDNPVLRKLYEGIYADPPPSFEEYVSHYPLFIYHDSLNRWVVFKNVYYGGEAECGKPVIYLYPTTPTQVSVKVGAKIRISEPEYGTGWNVLAEPTGKLDVVGSVYHSLFWEGLGNGPYPQITQGFVVKQAVLEQTLRDHMTKLGLNARESQDFMDFWWPKMPTTPYVRLTWFGTRQMDLLAPLEIVPRPDSVIRIFLDFEGLEKPITLREQRLSSIPRKGFTVIEWGGLLR